MNLYLPFRQAISYTHILQQLEQGYKERKSERESEKEIQKEIWRKNARQIEIVT